MRSKPWIGAALSLAQLAPPPLLAQARYDVVIAGGRVMDPETGLDAVRNVGIQGGRVARIAAEPLAGARVIDAKGLVVAPGFIDLHSHGQDDENYRLKAKDGVTTALELEIGAGDVAGFLREREGKALIHHGVAASHPAARVTALGATMPDGAIVPPAGRATDSPATAAQLERIKTLLREGLAAGALGIGMGLQYTPGATRLEVIETFRVAAEARAPVYVHVRSFGRIEPGSSIEAVSEVIGAAAVTGAPLHIVHVNSSGVADALECLRLVEGARARGLDVTTEAYPYGAGMTGINSALFNPGWRERLGVQYSDLQMVDTGEKLTAESFERYHKAPEQRLVIIHTNPSELVDAVMLHPLTIVASDGHIAKGKGHPRGAGTYARVLSRYVRGQGPAVADGRPPQVGASARAAARGRRDGRAPQGAAPGGRRRGHRRVRRRDRAGPLELRAPRRAQRRLPLRAGGRDARGGRRQARRGRVPRQGAGPPSALREQTVLELTAMHALNIMQALPAEESMASLTIRKLDEGTKGRLRVRAARHGRSMEEEARTLLRTALAEDAAAPGNLADSIRARFRPLAGVELKLPARKPIRKPPKPSR